jgi:hypothetical protein
MHSDPPFRSDPSQAPFETQGKQGKKGGHPKKQIPRPPMGTSAADVADGGLGMTPGLGCSHHCTRTDGCKRSCKSAKASGLPTKTGRPDLSYKDDGTLCRDSAVRVASRISRLASGSSGAAFHHAHRFQAHDNFFVLI